MLYFKVLLMHFGHMQRRDLCRNLVPVHVNRHVVFALIYSFPFNFRSIIEIQDLEEIGKGMS
jgi:hypothetical protein